MHDWIKSYISDRSQFTIVNGEASAVSLIQYGVPQGSVLGPLLFLLYINDIGYIQGLNYKPKLFADDTNLFVHSKTISELQDKAQEAINLISTWMLANRLTVNVDKTCYMIFMPSFKNNILPNFNLTLNASLIKKVKSCKF